MKVSRRGILAGLLVSGTTTPVVSGSTTPVSTPKPTFLKGQVLPRTVHRLAPLDWRVANSRLQAVAVIEYDIFDGQKFVPLDSEAGRRVVAELS